MKRIYLLPFLGCFLLTGSPGPVAWAANPAPGVPEPVRPNRLPVDLTDARACARELADVMTFALSIDAPANLRVQFVGVDPHPEAHRLLDATVRLEHLLGTSDESFRKVVREAQAIVVDCWRCNRGNKDLGSLGAKTISRSVLANLTFFGESMLDNALTPEEERNDFTPTPGEERAARRFENSMSGIRQDHEGRMDYSRRVATTMGVLQERAIELWQKELLPRLGIASNTPSGPALLAVASTAQANLQLGMVPLRATGKSLRQATIVVRQRGNQGDSLTWFGYLPELAAGHTFFTMPSGAFSEYFDDVNATSDVSFSVWSDQGVQHSGVSRLGRPPTPQSFAQQRQARDGLLRDEEERRQQVAGFLSSLRRRYPPPRNPVTARASLVAKFKPNQEYSATFANAGNREEVKIRFQPFTAESPVILATLTGRDQNGPITIPLLGRWAEEIERGCVIGLVHRWSSLERHVISDRRSRARGGDPQQAYPRSNVDLSAEQETLARVQKWARREIWLITSPADIAHFSPETSDHRLAQEITFLRALGVAQKSEREKRGEAAQYAVYLDRRGRLALQSPPDASRTTYHARLTDGSEPASGAGEPIAPAIQERSQPDPPPAATGRPRRRNL